MIRISFPVGVLGCNCTILGDETSREAVVIDPGDDVGRILRELQTHALTPTAIVHTHAHIDHVGATAALCLATGAQAYLHADDHFLYDLLPVQAQMLGFAEPERVAELRLLVPGQSVCFGGHELGVLHTPGHTPGSVCLVVPGADLCLSGDTLFAGGIGRTDLWGGDFAALKRSIQGELYSLHGATLVIPGHGPSTRIDVEKRTNPFVRG